jgi:hypothetical protein
VLAVGRADADGWVGWRESAPARGPRALTWTAVPGTSRAPLGNKTTNARARAARPGSGGKGGAALHLQHTIGNDIATGRPSATVKRRQAAEQRRSLRLSVRADTAGPEAEAEEQDDDDEEHEVEYGPPAPPEAPYESDVFPEGAISLDPLKPENLMRGYYEHFFDPTGNDGMPLKDKKLAQSVKRAVELAELEAQKMFDEGDWSVADVPETQVARVTRSAAAPVPASRSVGGKVVGALAKKTPAAGQRAAAAARPRTTIGRPATATNGSRPARAGAPASGLAKVRGTPPVTKSVTKPTTATRIGVSREVRPVEPAAAEIAPASVQKTALSDFALGEDDFARPLIVLPDEDDDEFELKFD